MKKTIKGFVLGIIITSLFMSTAFGATIKKTIEVTYNSVNLTVNGKKIVADNILYEGTTYVPLRAVADALGKEVGWDQATTTASVNDKEATQITPVAPAPAPAPAGETLSQKNAIKSAKSYLDYAAFSRSGLIKQLEFEEYSNKDATYAVDNITVDWKVQAVKSGKSYLKYTSFSRSGLIKQLEFEGFSNEEAIYAVDQIGL